MREMLLFGIHPIKEALQAGKTIDKVLIQKNLQGESYQNLLSELRKKNVKIQYVPIEKLNKVTRKNHQGIIAYVAPISFSTLDEIINFSYSDGRTPLLLILDRITDVRNFGAIARTAECTGVHGIIIPEKGSSPINADALKTSAGALFNIKVCKEVNLSKSVDLLQSSGIKVVGATEKTEELIYNEDLKTPLALVMGSEEDGISRSLMQKCDALAKLPLKGETDSLNVSVACGAILFEAVRQRL